VLKALGFTTSYVPGEAEIELYGVMYDGTVVLGANQLDGSSPGATSTLRPVMCTTSSPTEGCCWRTAITSIGRRPSAPTLAA